MRLYTLRKTKLDVRSVASFRTVLWGATLVALSACVSTQAASPEVAAPDAPMAAASPQAPVVGAAPVANAEPASVTVIQRVDVDQHVQNEVHVAASPPAVPDAQAHDAPRVDGWVTKQRSHRYPEAGSLRDPHVAQVVNNPAPPNVVQQAPKPAAPPARVRDATTAAQKPTPSTPDRGQAELVGVTSTTPAPADDGVASEDVAVATISESGRPEVAPIEGTATGELLAPESAAAPQPIAESAVSENPAPESIPAPEGEEFDDRDPSALKDFDPYLRDHGMWVEHPHYGTVWVPSRRVVGPKFVPYVSDGRWALTDEGDWVWVSDHPFGWVVYHYGRWIWTADHGWVWIAGRTYAPAWVRFRTFGQPYIGWGPLPPTFIWRAGFAVSLGVVYPVPYVFCPYGYAFYPGVSSYIIWERYRVRELVRRSRPLPPRYDHRHADRPHRQRVASPAVDDIPRNVRPTERVKPSPYAMALSRRGSTEKSRTRPFLTNRNVAYPRVNSGATRPATQFNRVPAPSNGARPGAVWPRTYENRGTLGQRRPPAGVSPSQRTSAPLTRGAEAPPRVDRARRLPPGAAAAEARTNPPRRLDTRRVDETRRRPDARRPEPRVQRPDSSRRIDQARQAAPSRPAPTRIDQTRRAEPPRRTDAPRRADPPRRAEPPRRIEAPRRSEPPRRMEAPRRMEPSRSFSPRSGSAPNRSFGGGGGGRRR